MSSATAITIGNFDGVHAGHAELVRRARSLVGGGRVVALAFDPHPASVLRPGSEPARLTTFTRRAELLQGAGADEVIRLEPAPAFLALSPQDFVARLVRDHSPRFIVEGDDFHFGRGRAGSIATLETLGRAHGFETHIVSPIDVALSDQLIARASSTLIRWLLARGRVSDAAILLKRPYELSGEVVGGDQRGRTIGFPTANLKTPLMLPADGIYAGLADLPDGRTFPAAINIGTRPTFNGVERRAEAFIMDDAVSNPVPARLDGIPEYGWPLTLRFTAWLRDDLKFSSVQALVEQIARDCRRALDQAESPACR